MEAGSRGWGASLSSNGTNLWQQDDVFSRSSSHAQDEEDDEALKWAALEKLPTLNRMRASILRKVRDDGSILLEEIDVAKLRVQDYRQIIGKILRVAEEDNAQLLFKLRSRLDRVRIELPKVEVRFQNLEVHANVHRGSRAITSIPNSFINTAQTILTHLYILPSRKESISILRNISGIVKPSRLTLLLGPPGSGKSSLLLALANKLDPNLRVRGEVTYNGHRFHEFVPQKTSAYISQHDLHMWELTVRETLNFSARCQGVGSRYEVLAELSRREKNAGIKPDPDLDAFMKATAVEGHKANIITDYIIQILGLDICADTLVGNALKRGISGGQKKRVTTGEILVGPAKVLFMDEISTGLDSSTTFQIVKCLQQTVQALDETMLISLLQPAPETFELFDDLILLSEGQIVYQGPRDTVLDFFETQGFRCPERKGVADFLQEVTSRKDQAKFRVGGREAYQFVTVKEFAAAFQRYHVGQHIAQELAKPFMKSNCHPAALATKKYTLSSWELLKACTSREVILMKRNLLVYAVNIAQGTFLAIVITTLFLRTTMHHRNVQDGNKYMGALFYSLINIMFRGIAEMGLTVSRLPAFYKQRDMLFYPPWAWALPAIVLKIPMSAFEAGVWIAITYWGVGFAPEASRCFRQYFILFMLNQAALALFRCIASIARMLTFTGTLGFLVLIIIVVNGGFLKSRENIQPWWIWTYWISPLMYGQNAIAVNEFLAERWHKPLAGTSDTIGEALLKARGIFPHGYWYWIGIGGLAGCILLFNTIYILALTFLNPLGAVQSTLVSEELPREDSANNNAKEMQPADTESGGMPPRRGMRLPFQPLSMAFNNISYYVDMPPEMRQQGGMADERLQLLRNVSGAFRPGVLTALIGVSGAGKTTLMDVLAGRKTGGYIEGYCEQNDIHSPNVTVHESLVFSAWLRLAKTIDKKTRMMFVEEVMDLVELTPLRNASVGLPGVSGLSTEQRKRLTIAVELVANPSIMFMDEPTSGLDARAAAIVMRAVRNTLDTGRTVVCTIHQPSIDIFESFDELLLMKRGGQLIYAGPLGRRSCHMIEYFQAIAGIPSIKDGYNPSTWALEVTSQSVEQKLGVDFSRIYEESVLYQQNQACIKEISTPAPQSHDLHFPTKYSLPFLEQCLACVWREHCSHWRNPVYFYSRMFDGVVLGFLLATMFWNTGSKRANQQDVFNLLGAMYTSVLFLGFNNSGAVQQLVAIERIILYREKAAGMYSALPYALAQVLVKVPYVLLQAGTYGILMYLIMNLERTAAKFFSFIFFMSSTFLYYTFFGMLTAALTPTLQLGSILSVCIYAFWNIFSGLLVPLPKIPPWWKWNYWASPAAWTLNGIITSQLGDVETTMEIPDQPPARVKDFINDYFGFQYDFLPVVVVMHIVFPVVYALIFAACITHLRFQRR